MCEESACFFNVFSGGVKKLSLVHAKLIINMVNIPSSLRSVARTTSELARYCPRTKVRTSSVVRSTHLLSITFF